jgi:hypothetical protein
VKYNPNIVAAFLASFGITKPEFEYRFHPERKWRFDLAWPAAKVALEIDGAVWSGGRHTRGSGWLKDTEKLNAAACLGWRMLRCMPKDLCIKETAEIVRAAISNTQAMREELERLRDVVCPADIESIDAVLSESQKEEIRHSDVVGCLQEVARKTLEQEQAANAALSHADET